jgi:hypothetical protein
MNLNRPADHHPVPNWRHLWDAIMPIVWTAVCTVRMTRELAPWRKGDGELCVGEADIKMAAVKAQRSVASNTQLKLVSGAANNLTGAGLVWGAIGEMFSRRVQICANQGGLQLPRLVAKHGQPIQRRRGPRTDEDAALYRPLPSAVPGFVVPAWVPCLLESCFGNLRHQRCMPPAMCTPHARFLAGTCSHMHTSCRCFRTACVGAGQAMRRPPAYGCLVLTACLGASPSKS